MNKLLEAEKQTEPRKRRKGIEFRKFFLRGIGESCVSRRVRVFNYALILLGVYFLLKFSFAKLNYTYMWRETVVEYKYKFVFGFFVTIIISFFSLLCSLAIGTFFALGQKSRLLPLHYFSKFYIEVIRGTPLIVQIYLFFYVIGTAFNIVNRYMMGVLIMAVFSGAYVAEIIRAGIESIDSSQIETCKALGFSKYQKYRYIIFPQVVKRIMPSLAGQFASLIKDSSLLSIIAVNEFTKNVQEVDSLTFAPIENYFVLALGYIILTYPISHISKILERKFSYEA